MADDDLRRAEREWLADESSQAALARWIEARGRAGLPVGHDLLERQVHPAGRLAPPAAGQVWVEPPDGDPVQLPRGEAGVDCPAHRRAWLALEAPPASLAALGPLAGFQGLRLALPDPAVEGDLSGAEITHLGLAARELGPDLLARLAAAPRLASLELELHGPLDPEALAPLAGARQLTRLRLRASLEPGALAALGALPALAELEVEDLGGAGPSFADELEGLARASGLVALRIPELGVEVDDALLEALADRLPRLRVLCLPYGDAPTDAGLAHVCRLPLEELDLRSFAFTPDGLAGLPAGLRELTVKAPPGPLAWLRRLPALTRLHLELHARTSDADLAALAGCARLERVWLAFAVWGEASGRALEHLRGCAALRGLDLSGLGDLRPGREALAALPLEELLLLDVGGVEDGALASFLPAGLRRLELVGCEGVGEEGLRALAAARPELVVRA